jgi:hypothetical protein
MTAKIPRVKSSLNFFVNETSQIQVNDFKIIYREKEYTLRFNDLIARLLNGSD